MGGIIGIVGKTNVAPLLVESLARLEDRRGDSCGLAILDEEMGIDLRKDEGPVEEVAVRFDMISAPGELGIAHTRWATHGGVSPENAHPHLSCDRRFGVVHNGIISNHEEIRKGLRDRGSHFFFSDTDTEVIVHLMEEVYQPSLSVEQAFVRMLRHLEGTFAIALISTHEPRKIFCARQDSPLIIGIDSETKFVSSDINAFLPYTRQALPLDDDEYAVLLPDAYWIKDIAIGDVRNRQVTEIQSQGNQGADLLRLAGERFILNLGSGE
jgi:glutamine---fructose-6-phosphate transaminase (isomerizing)